MQVSTWIYEETKPEECGKIDGDTLVAVMLRELKHGYYNKPLNEWEMTDRSCLDK